MAASAAASIRGWIGRERGEREEREEIERREEEEGGKGDDMRSDIMTIEKNLVHS